LENNKDIEWQTDLSDYFFLQFNAADLIGMASSIIVLAIFLIWSSIPPNLATAPIIVDLEF